MQLAWSVAPKFVHLGSSPWKGLRNKAAMFRDYLDGSSILQQRWAVVIVYHFPHGYLGYSWAIPPFLDGNFRNLNKLEVLTICKACFSRLCSREHHKIWPEIWYAVPPLERILKISLWSLSEGIKHYWPWSSYNYKWQFSIAGWWFETAKIGDISRPPSRCRQALRLLLQQRCLFPMVPREPAQAPPGTVPHLG